MMMMMKALLIAAALLCCVATAQLRGSSMGSSVRQQRRLGGRKLQRRGTEGGFPTTNDMITNNNMDGTAVAGTTGRGDANQRGLQQQQQQQFGPYGPTAAGTMQMESSSTSNMATAVSGSSGGVSGSSSGGNAISGSSSVGNNERGGSGGRGIMGMDSIFIEGCRGSSLGCAETTVANLSDGEEGMVTGSSGETGDGRIPATSPQTLPPFRPSFNYHTCPNSYSQKFHARISEDATTKFCSSNDDCVDYLQLRPSCCLFPQCLCGPYDADAPDRQECLVY